MTYMPRREFCKLTALAVPALAVEGATGWAQSDTRRQRSLLKELPSSAEVEGNAGLQSYVDMCRARLSPLKDFREADSNIEAKILASLGELRNQVPAAVAPATRIAAKTKMYIYTSEVPKLSTQTFQSKDTKSAVFVVTVSTGGLNKVFRNDRLSKLPLVMNSRIIFSN